MGHSNEIAREAQRPWIEIELLESFPLTIENGKIKLGARFVFWNRGQSPAVKAFVKAQLAMHPFNDGLLSFNLEKDKVSSELDRIEENTKMSGLTIFPGSKHTYIYTDEKEIEFKECDNFEENFVLFFAVGVTYMFDNKFGRSISSFMVLQQDVRGIAIRLPHLEIGQRIIRLEETFTSATA